MSTKQLKTALLGMALASIAYAAQAAPVTFTWTPAAASPPLVGGPIVDANNFNVSDFANVQINNTSGAFTETGGLLVQNFLNGGATVASPGLGSTYSLFFTFSGSGTQGAIPTAGNSTNGTFSTLNYTLWGVNAPNPTFGVTSSPVTVNGSPVTGSPPIAGAIALGSGSLINGVSTLTAVSMPGGGTGYSPTANLNLNFTAAPGESGFFTSPPPSALSLLISNFSATTSVTTLADNGNGTSSLEINGGGGNLTFETRTAVPEPSSLLLFGSGLVGLGLLVRRRRKA